MLDFTPVRNKEKTMLELVGHLRADHLRLLTNEMLDHQLALIKDCTDADVVFVPSDPGAKDDAAQTPEEVNMPWTLGHVIVHITASAEEAAYMSVELARGVEYRGGRSRYETHWTTVKKIAECRERMEESRRMRLAALDMWPAEPHLANKYRPRPEMPEGNCVSRFAAGLSHDDAHLGQIADVVRQARAAHK